jgi:hypothetical protein
MRMENPLVGTFNRERTMLTFSQRSLEVTAAYVALFGGGGMVLFGLINFLLSGGLTGQALWLVTFGGMFAGAAAWALLLFRSIKFDLRKRAYVMRKSMGMVPEVRRGSTQEIRCLELAPFDGLLPAAIIQQQGTGLIGGAAGLGGIYVLRLWWHDASREPIVIEHVQAMQTYGHLDMLLAGFGQKAQMYASALQVPLYSQIPLPGMQRIN